jgi:hypothetical protein
MISIGLERRSRGWGRGIVSEGDGLVSVKKGREKRSVAWKEGSRPVGGVAKELKKRLRKGETSAHQYPRSLGTNFLYHFERYSRV